jgi:hypothetical protein
VNARAGDLHYDLATSVDGHTPPSLVEAGLERPGAADAGVPRLPSADGWGWTPVAIVLVGAAVIGMITMTVRNRRRELRT